MNSIGLKEGDGGQGEDSSSPQVQPPLFPGAEAGQRNESSKIWRSNKPLNSHRQEAGGRLAPQPLAANEGKLEGRVSILDTSLLMGDSRSSALVPSSNSFFPITLFRIKIIYVAFHMESC